MPSTRRAEGVLADRVRATWRTVSVTLRHLSFLLLSLAHPNWHLLAHRHRKQYNCAVISFSEAYCALARPRRRGLFLFLCALRSNSHSL